MKQTKADLIKENERLRILAEKFRGQTLRLRRALEDIVEFHLLNWSIEHNRKTIAKTALKNVI